MASSSKQSWQVGDAGILRKKEEEEELLVFGYSCKLFRDDEKALYIDQGKHLIPWMGDETLKIDRYDGRGALYDLRQCEALPGGYDENLWVGLSDSERRVEQLCNEERYRSLNRNEEEEELHQEEELKRLHQALGGKSYGEVGFDYNKGSGPTKADGDSNSDVKDCQTNDDEDQPFVPPPELDIPVNMVLPDRVKLNAIIEKTALFISSQGAQMEILLKMKQAKNPQFEFLSYDAPLHPYYRYLQMAIKTGRYHPKADKIETEENPDDDDNDGDYLHPSLAPSSRVELAPSIPSIAYKPSADCAYSMLVNRIKDKQAAFSVPPPGTSEVLIPPPPVQTVQLAPASKLTPLVIEATPVLYNQPETVAATESSHGVAPSLQAPVKIFTPVTQVAAVPAATAGNGHPTRYATGPVGYTNNVPKLTTSFLTPPQDVQLIIDKMASYVAKNGRDFEAIVRSKGDPRFEFLQVSHQYYPYYLYKVDVYEQIEKPVLVAAAVPVEPVVVKKAPIEVAPPEVSSESEDANEDSTDGTDADLSAKPALAPVCFSIKKPKESDAVLDKKSALPQEESSDEESKEKKEPSVDLPAEDDTELIDLTDETAMIVDIEEVYDKEKKNADKEKWEERVKDKLAAAARGKMAATSRDRQLQLERKRRAAVFLTMLHKPPPTADNNKGPTSQGATPRASGDEDEVSSIPSITSLASSVSRGGTPALEEAVKTPSSLLARLQGGRELEKRVGRESSSDSDHRDRRRTKKTKILHRRDVSKSPEPRLHKRKKDEGHKSSKKSKKRDRSSSRTPVKQHKSDRHKYEISSKSREGREGRSSKKKSQKKSRRRSDSDRSS